MLRRFALVVNKALNICEKQMLHIFQYVECWTCLRIQSVNALLSRKLSKIELLFSIAETFRGCVNKIELFADVQYRGRYIRSLLLLYLLKEGEIRNVVCKDTPFLLLLKKIQQQRVSLCLKFTKYIALKFSRQDSGFVSNLWNLCFFSIPEKWRLF